MIENLRTEPIVKSLDRIAKILVALVLKDIGECNQIEKIARLKQCGFQNVEIAEMLGTTANTVTVQLHSHRSRKRRKRGAKQSKPKQGRKR